MKRLMSGLLAAASLSAGQGKQTFVGVITDDVCGKGGHAQMQMRPTDRECAIACTGAHGAAYALYDGKEVYGLSDQRTPEEFAGRKVNVTGTLDAKTRRISVDSIRAAK